MTTPCGAARLHDGPRPADAAPKPGHRSGRHLRVERATLTTPEVEVGQALADVATVGLLQERSLREARLLNEQLQAALNSRIASSRWTSPSRLCGATRATPTRSAACGPRVGRRHAERGVTRHSLSNADRTMVRSNQRSTPVAPDPGDACRGEASTWRPHQLESRTRKTPNPTWLIGRARAPNSPCSKSFTWCSTRPGRPRSRPTGC
jgi:hypothetical protein